jgi:hypothetical protein
MAYNCEQRIDELKRLLIANQDCVDNVVDAYLQLEAEVAELKAKLEEKDILIYNLKQLDKSMDANVNAYIAKLESQLAAQDWHDASELPTEEGKYIMGFTGLWDGVNGFHLVYNWANGGSQGSDYEQDYAVQIFTNKRDMESEIDGSWDDYGYDKNRQYFWRRIIPPEGK